MMRGTIAAALALSFCSGAAQAQQAAAERTLEPFARCRSIAAAQPRADCFDAAAQALEKAVAAKEITIVSRQDVRTARRSLFGFTLPHIGLFGSGQDDHGPEDQEPEFRQLDTTIVSSRAAANGRVELQVAEGNALWVTTDPMPFPPKPGRKVRIRKGTMGNYFIAVEGERSVRGMRLR